MQNIHHGKNIRSKPRGADENKILRIPTALTLGAAPQASIPHQRPHKLNERNHTMVRLIPT